MTSPERDAVAEMLAKQEIRDQLSRYCHALDRMDKPMARAVWHDDGTAHYIDMFEGTGRGFVDWVWEQHAAMECHSHQISNVLVRVDGERARSEAYVTVQLWLRADAEGKRAQITARSRYLDRWSFREGRWAIDHRVHVLDMQSARTLAASEQAGPQSSRDATDPARILFEDN